MDYVQHPPFSVQIEPVEGCNLACTFCGINNIREHAGGPFKFMTVHTISNLASQIAAAEWNPRIEFAMHGEPTMHPELPLLVSKVREKLPKASIMVTSNGGGLLRDLSLAKKLFLSGLNTLALDDYVSVKIVPKLREKLKPELLKQGIPWYEYPSEKIGNPHARQPPKTKRVVVIEDISVAREGTHSHLKNHCGSASPKNYSFNGLRCARPFREVAIRWDGGVSWCCDDWPGYAKIGNINETSIYELWHCKAMYAIRKKLYHGQRDMGPCSGCDEVSYRPGLLPDKLGKENLPLPNKGDIEELLKVLAGPPMVATVPRPWENRVVKIHLRKEKQ